MIKYLGWNRSVYELIEAFLSQQSFSQQLQLVIFSFSELLTQHLVIYCFVTSLTLSYFTVILILFFQLTSTCAHLNLPTRFQTHLRPGLCIILLYAPKRYLKCPII